MIPNFTFKIGKATFLIFLVTNILTFLYLLTARMTQAADAPAAARLRGAVTPIMMMTISAVCSVVVCPNSGSSVGVLSTTVTSLILSNSTSRLSAIQLSLHRANGLLCFFLVKTNLHCIL